VLHKKIQSEEDVALFGAASVETTGELLCFPEILLHSRRSLSLSVDQFYFLDMDEATARCHPWHATWLDAAVGTTAVFVEQGALNDRSNRLEPTERLGSERQSVL
jgi:hypothetical protein